MKSDFLLALLKTGGSIGSFRKYERCPSSERHEHYSKLGGVSTIPVPEQLFRSLSLEDGIEAMKIPDVGEQLASIGDGLGQTADRWTKGPAETYIGGIRDKPGRRYLGHDLLNLWANSHCDQNILRSCTSISSLYPHHGRCICMKYQFEP